VVVSFIGEENHRSVAKSLSNFIT